MSNGRGIAESPAVTAIMVAPASRHGVSHAIVATINAVLSQTLGALELILVDPAGQGGSASLAERFGDKRLRLVHASEKASPWDQGLASARGRFVVFLQAGEICRPTRFSAQAAALDARPDIALLSCLSRVLEGGIPLPANPSEASGPAPLCTLMVRREAAASLAGGLPPSGEPGFLAHALSRRLSTLGAGACLPETLVLRAAEETALPDSLAEPARAGKLFDTVYQPCRQNSKAAPALFVVVDTEAEFDWTKPFARELTSVSAMDDIERGQAVFDEYGLRPIYVVDYPVATQKQGFGRLRAIMERDGCEIGAHLHPWTTPPFEEALSARNSYPGNLDPLLEERKLAVLMQAIHENFGISPIFYKAGRYGFGPMTPQALVRHGIKVDLSVLPGADLRRQGGPDFRALKPALYRIGGTDILSLPMTRSEVGIFPALARLGAAVHAWPGGRVLHLPSALARLRLAETITLTPEGVTEAEQIRLIRAMLRRGCRQFVLHYHSPSLSPGHTPYARDRMAAETLIARLRSVCRFFFQELGGLPGYPRDLLSARPYTPEFTPW